MILLDISWGKLLPRDLVTISIALGTASSMRNLNLSYNRLNFDEVADPVQASDSMVFMNNIKIFFENAMFVNHINFSGMDFLPKQLTQLMEMLKQC